MLLVRYLVHDGIDEIRTETPLTFGFCMVVVVHLFYYII